MLPETTFHGEGVSQLKVFESIIDTRTYNRMIFPRIPYVGISCKIVKIMVNNKK